MQGNGLLFRYSVDWLAELPNQKMVHSPAPEIGHSRSHGPMGHSFLGQVHTTGLMDPMDAAQASSCRCW